MQAGFAEMLRVNVIRLRTLYELGALYGGLLCFALMGLVWSIPAGVLYIILPRALGERVGRRVIMLAFRTYLAALRAAGVLRYDLAALDALRDEGALIITTNHPSLIDIVLIASRLPRTVCIMKAGLLNNPLLGLGARLAGYIRNDPSWSMIHKSIASVRAGSQLLVFPEGTRTDTLPVSPFKEGFAIVAQKAHAPVQTVFIETNNSAFLGKGWPLLRKPDFPLEYRVRLGRRFEAGEDVRCFVRELESYYAAELSRTGAANASGRKP
jgi:1-acyl-sn-glycerol-3-phosphate acyltransferase